MRVLFLTSRVPWPPEVGDRFRVFHFLRTLAQAGHEVHLLSFATGAGTHEDLMPLARLAASTSIVHLPVAVSSLRALREVAGKRPLQLAWYDSRRMLDRAREAVARLQPDILYTHLFRMAPYALAAEGLTRAHRVLDLTDVISAGIARSLRFRAGIDRWVYAREGPRIEAYERAVAPRFDSVWVISDAEARALRAIAPSANVRVVPNGLPPEPPAPTVRRDPLRLLFLGYQGVLHNSDAAHFLAHEIFPLVRAQVPGATLDIAGKGSEALRRTIHGEGIRVLGRVENLADTVAGAAVFVAPHRFAAGVQNKVVHALACGTPVVTTPLVRAGLEPVPDGALSLGETAPELAERVVDLLRGPAEAARRAAIGREWAVARFGWNEALREFERLAPARA
jgi:glycosyltransferase involved in cell wall biosynthesis